MMSNVITLMHDQLIDKLSLKGFVMYDLDAKTEELLQAMKFGAEDSNAKSICAASIKKNHHIIKAAHKKGVHLITRFYSSGGINNQCAVFYEEQHNSVGAFKKP